MIFIVVDVMLTKIYILLQGFNSKNMVIINKYEYILHIITYNSDT